MKRLSYNSGFTLIETLIYAALVSVVIGMILMVTFQIVSGSRGLNEKIFMEDEASFLLRKIEWATAGASAINSPISGQSSSDTLSVDKFEIDPTDNPIVFSVSDGDLLMREGTGSEVRLNSPLLTIENATFTHIAATGTAPEGVKVELSVVGASPSDHNAYELTTYLRQ